MISKYSSTHSRLAEALSTYLHRLRSIPEERPNAEFLEQVDFASDQVSLSERTPIIELVLREHLHEKLLQDVRIDDAFEEVCRAISFLTITHFTPIYTGTFPFI